ncbi:hypothetical protein KI387_009175 [Taxus chinensis]|uniref:Uncharacterized protein n=1 Tax=Taxus chinensis TaxID=29808 RepID=A0AA38CS65_TAXCH|nr:hypothetical protein KI387_009175 [Taxus chinensis]
MAPPTPKPPPAPTPYTARTSKARTMTLEAIGPGGECLQLWRDNFQQHKRVHAYGYDVGSDSNLRLLSSAITQCFKDNPSGLPSSILPWMLHDSGGEELVRLTENDPRRCRHIPSNVFINTSKELGNCLILFEY